MIDTMDPWPYPECEILRRDVVYFYELQSEYATIEPDIAWDMFSLRYWDFLAMHVPSEEHFLERGCLTIIVAGALAHGGNICHAFGSTPISHCQEAVAAAHYSDAVTERIRTVALTALDLALVDNGARDYGRLACLPGAAWVHASTVRAYFRSREASLRRVGLCVPDDERE